MNEDLKKGDIVLAFLSYSDLVNNKLRPSLVRYHKWELRAWPVIKPHLSDLNCLSPPNGWRSGENKDDSGYKSFFEEAEHEMK
jgi:hypothetical protein